MTTSHQHFAVGSPALAQGGPPPERPAQAPAVDIAVATTGSLAETLSYTGTTQPLRQVTLRSRGEGLLLSLSVDVGDPVQEGQVIGQLDDVLSQADLRQSQAELAARESEVIQAQTQVSQAQSQVERERVALQQAEADAERLATLAAEGAISQQDAEQARTAARTAQQVLLSAEQQIGSQEQAVLAAQERVAIQQAVIQQAQERTSQSSLQAPLSGLVISRVLGTGDLVRVGDEVLTIGDFSQIKIALQLSELDLGKVQPGQAVTVDLDAFPGQSFNGQVSRIAPSADPVARLIPVEVTIPNPQGRISGGLLARIRLGDPTLRVVVPEAAVRDETGDPMVFIAARNGDEVNITARSVTLGSRANGQVEILSGLEVGEAYVSRAEGALEDGQTVRVSILSDWEG